ncbi:MAG: M15 family metallopeptidase [Clostridia bacterium]|nr:M15 family metallopeptidase [Clostridia bacterium]
MNYLLLVNKNNPLPDNYVPNNLIVMNSKYCFEEDRIYELETNAYQAFEKMVKSAEQVNINLKICSSYRSYEYQSLLYQKYVHKDGEKIASTYSAKPGYSEHQTGLAIDFIEQSEDEIFDITQSHYWLDQNAHKYGFIMRYPKGKESITGYKYEPWHYRYVGELAANDIKNRKITLEEYLEEK